MRKIATLGTALALVAGSALAADLPSRKEAPVYAPPPPVFSWTGLYAGANIGGGWLDRYNHTGWVASWDGFGWVSAYQWTPGSVSNGGVVGGGQIGYNYQLAPWLVVGAETDFQGSSIGGGGGGSGWNGWGGFGLGGGAARSVDWFGTVRGRVGFLWPGYQQFLVYATGGFAYGDLSLNHGWLGTLSQTATGWTIGGGIEYALASFPNWSVKGEYLYTNIGNSYWGGFNSWQHRVHMQTVRAGVNYRFNWGASAPVLAKY
jgi:outer membrane immunogenic protein